MSKRARDVMTVNPAFCTPDTSLDRVARLMVQHDCGEIPVVDPAEQVVGVVTDRDIVCRVVAEGRTRWPTRPNLHVRPAVTVTQVAALNDVLTTMEKHQIRRVPVVDERGGCVGMISQADVAWAARKRGRRTGARSVPRHRRHLALKRRPPCERC